MAPINLVCPECNKKMSAPAEVAGKKVRCKSCGEVFVARAAGGITAPAEGGKKQPARSSPARAPAPRPKPEPEEPAAEEAIPFKDDDDEDDGNPYGITTVDLTPRCPHCANEMEDERAVICLHCGYNTRTRQMGQTRKTYDVTGMDYFIWWLPGILCVLGIIFLIVFDILYCLYAQDWFEDSWAEFLAHFAIKLWLVIFSLFAMYYLGKYAFIRLALNYQPPEVERK